MIWGELCLKKSLIERFESHFTKTDGCWEWMATRSINGYGRINIDGKYYGAHRVAYNLYIGDLPDNMCVCHHCDNPGCVNPSHLFLGTRSDNMKDCVKKGRRRLPVASGEKPAGYKLTEEQVMEIRSKYPGDKSQRKIASEYGVSQSEIWRIIHRVHWANI